MSRLKKYNHILLALIGTLALISLLMLTGFGFYTLYQEASWSYEDQIEVSIISNEKAEKLAKDSTWKQLITFDRLQLIDSTVEKFVIPVDQVSLLKRDMINDNDLLGLTNSFTRYDGKYYYGTNYFSNLLIYDGNNKNLVEVFKERVCISNFRTIDINKNIFLSITLIKGDTNKDGYLNNEDLRKLAFYDVTNNKLIEIENDHATFIRLRQLEFSNEPIALYGKDKNKNGLFESEKEPMFLYKIAEENGETELLVDEEFLLTLQKRLDGRMKE